VLDLLAQTVPVVEEEAAAMKAAEQRFAAKPLWRSIATI